MLVLLHDISVHSYGNFYRPLVPVLLSGPTDSLVLEALVDTGADITVVDIELAPVLGVILDERRTVTVSGLAGKTIGYQASITCTIGDQVFLKVPVLFAKLAPQSYGVLGHAGLFDRMKLTFEFHKRQFTIITRR